MKDYTKLHELSKHGSGKVLERERENELKKILELPMEVEFQMGEAFSVRNYWFSDMMTIQQY